MADPAEDLLPLMGFNFLGNNQQDDSDSEDSEENDSSSNEDGDTSNEGEEESNDGGIEGGGEQEHAEVAEPKQKKQKKSSSASQQDSKRRTQVIVNFDQNLPATHSYLGSDLEEMRGRTILEENATVTLPLVVLPNVVLVPGQVIPLQLFMQRLVAMMRRVADADKTFGVINMSGMMAEGESISPIGCTAEIFSMKDEMDEASGISMVCVKARGRQRFKVLNIHTDVTGELSAQVKILPEVSLNHPLDGACLPSLKKFMVRSEGDDDMVKTAVGRHGQVLASVDLRTLRRVDKMVNANFTRWPPWLYKMYDIDWLAEQICSELGSWSSTSLPIDPVELSFWVAHNLPVDDETRLALLSFDSVVQRLRFGLSIIRKSGFLLSCKGCGKDIANRHDVFSMSREGPLGAYVNPGGYVHEMFTVLAVTNLRNIGGSSTEHSWFPGYAWTIVQCKSCHDHMGWMFTAAKKGLSPKKFWGLCRSSVKTTISAMEEKDGEPGLVM